MGDFRNKIRRILQDERIAARLQEQFARDRAKPPPPTCGCGFNWYDTELVNDSSEGAVLYCRACAPDPLLAIMWPTPENDAMCNDYERELAVAQAIDYMEEMKHTPPFAWAGGRIPNDIGLQPHIRIHDKGFILRLDGGQLQGSMTRWAWDQGKRPVYNFRSDGRDFTNSDRCLILASAFYEYTDPAPAKPKVKLKDQHRFTMKGQPFFWVAGIVKDGSFAMLTTEPGADIRPYHDRQIVVLPPAKGMAWLESASPELLAPAPTGTLAHRTTRRNGIEI